MNELFPSRRDFINLNKGILDNAFDNLFSDTSDFKVDITEKNDLYKLEADLPGLTKDDIQINYDDNILSIHAHQETSHEEKDEEENYVRRERSSRSYSRQFLIKNIDEDSIQAKFENGVLTVDLPKKENAEQKRKQIEIQ